MQLWVVWAGLKLGLRRTVQNCPKQNQVRNLVWF